MADLYYTGSLSFLNQAEAIEIPELTITDVYLMQKQLCPAQWLDKPMAQEIFDISGGHPRLIDYCLNLSLKERNTKKPDYLTILTQSPFVWQLFIPFAQDQNRRERLCQLLQRDEVAISQPYLFDPLIRRLYWKNLLKRDPKNRHLLWRCDVFRIAGQEILGGKERG